jgi:hypothetical protein
MALTVAAAAATAVLGIVASMMQGQTPQEPWHEQWSVLRSCTGNLHTGAGRSSFHTCSGRAPSLCARLMRAAGAFSHGARGRSGAGAAAVLRRSLRPYAGPDCRPGQAANHVRSVWGQLLCSVTVLLSQTGQLPSMAPSYLMLWRSCERRCMASLPQRTARRAWASP